MIATQIDIPLIDVDRYAYGQCPILSPAGLVITRSSGPCLTATSTERDGRDFVWFFFGVSVGELQARYMVTHAIPVVEESVAQPNEHDAETRVLSTRTRPARRNTLCK